MFDSISSFFAPSGKRTRRAFRKTQRPQRRARLEVDTLEVRCVPTIITVIGSGDGTGSFDAANHTDTTLRGAINSSASGDTIEFASGLAPIVLTSGTELPLTLDLTIQNLNASLVTIDGNATSRIFDISNSATVTIANLKLTNGNPDTSANTSAYGGAVYSAYSTLTVKNCLITGNNAPTGACGGIWERGGNLTIQNSTIANNVAGGEGGGIGIDDGATVTIQNSTISGNSANNNTSATNPRRGGGGIWCTLSTLTIQNSTISGNTAGAVSSPPAGVSTGGGIDLYASTTTIESSTITGNTAVTHGGGIAVIGTSSGTTSLTLRNSVVSGDSDGTGANDLYRHDYMSGTTTVVPTINASSCLIQNPGPGPQGFINGTNTGNIFNTDPKLGALANNGGPTQTHVLLPGSPALDQGNSALAPFPFDQRGSPFARVVGSSVDIGAFEVQATALATVTGTLFLDYNASGVRDIVEPGIAGLTILLDANGNGAVDPGEPSAVTDGSGGYSLSNVAPGAYTLSLAVLPAHGFLYTVAAAGRTLVLAAGANVSADLGVVPISQVAPLTATAADLFAPHPNPDANTAFVRGLYHSILGRDAEAAGLAAWVGALASGGTRTQVTQGIWNSVEHRGQQVDAFYLTFLRRAADLPGRNVAINALLSGATEEQVALAFLTSAEYGTLHLLDGSFVDALYLDVLSRTESLVERTAAVAALGGGTTRAALAQLFVTCNESHARAVDSFYAVFLHRQGEPAGRAAWLAVLNSGGLSDGQVAQAFFPTPEFAADAASAVP